MTIRTSHPPASSGVLRRSLVLATLAIGAAAALGTGGRAALPVTRVETVGFTVSDMARALDFYTRVLPFSIVSDVEVSGRAYELLTGIFGARARVATAAGRRTDRADRLLRAARPPVSGGHEAQ
jgi:hypothetical protein